eukprot:XP_017948651.1 PREDICTED: mucin-5AC-like [Xenopus tropicalis]
MVDACCGTCVHVACTMKMDDNTTKVLQPGETYTPKEDECTTYVCKPDFDLEKQKEKCAITDQSQCSKAEVYKIEVGACCGICVPVACTVKMEDNTIKVMKPGETYTPDKDKCTSYVCKPDLKVETHMETCPITKQSDCPEAYEYQPAKDACCGSCIKVACPVKMSDNSVNILKPGETFTPVDDKCITYTCKPDLEVETLKEKCAINEQSQCPEGYEYEKPDGKCCGSCKQVECVMSTSDNSTKTMKPDETYTPKDDKCITYKCSPTYDIIKIMESCPPFDANECKEKQGTVKMSANGCCQLCEIHQKAGCLVQKDVKIITFGSCESEQTVEMAYCEGTCSTKSIYSADSNSMEHSCSCCQEKKTSQRQVDLKCKDGSKSVFSYTYVEECGCTSTECQDNTQQSKKKL